jgi:head-tail adaptor
MIKRYYKTTFTIYRQNWANESSSLQYVVGFKGHLQQASDEEIANLASIYTLTHKIWCGATIDVQAGDRLTDGTYSYTVKSVNKKDFAGRNKHLEIMAEKDLSFTSA